MNIKNFRKLAVCGINHNSYIFWQASLPGGDRLPEKRNWKEYNEHRIRRGEILFSLDFLDEEIDEMNKGKRGRPYEYPERFAIFIVSI